MSLKSELPKVSVYTPFLRRFTDERARDLVETRALYARVWERFAASRWSGPDAKPDFARGIVAQLIDRYDVPANAALAQAMAQCLFDLLDLETTIFDCPEIELETAILSLEEHVDLRRFLRAKEHFLANDTELARRLADALAEALGGTLGFLGALPADEADTPAGFSIPLFARIERLPRLVDGLIGTLADPKLVDAGLCVALYERLSRNIHTLSGVPLDRDSTKPLLHATDSKLPPEALVAAYLGGTPLQDLLATPLPFALPEQSRLEHTHIVAGSGHGKTQTLQHLIQADLMRPPDEVPGLVIIDSQGDMLNKLARLDLFTPGSGALADRLVIVDPTDIDHPPALGLFDLDLDRLGRYGAREREQIMNGVIELYDYIFGGLLGAELTQKQNVIFRYLARLMLVIPNANILTLKQVMQDPTPFVRYFEKLDGMARDFFLTEFNDRQFAETKKQILRRLWGILENPTFERLFSNPRNKLDMFSALNQGKIILVNTAKDFLKAERSSILGRFFIALTFQAALERAALPEHQRRPAFLYIDEAADYFDDTIDSLLSQARKFKLGVVFAHQHLDQLSRPLLASIMTNTSIKFAGGVSASDAHALARNMGTSPEHLSAVRKRARHTEFSVFVRNHTEAALTLSIPLGSLEAATTMPPEAFRLLTDQNRRRITAAAIPESAGVNSHAAGAPKTAPAMGTVVSTATDEDWRS